MRITTQMLASSAAKSGLEFNQASLLDMVTNKNSTGNLLSNIGNNKEIKLSELNKKSYKELSNASDILCIYSSKLNATDEKSLYSKAIKENDDSLVKTSVKNIVNSYNTMVDQLTKIGGELNDYYLKELKALPKENKDKLEEIGMSLGTDGKLQIDDSKFDKSSLLSVKSIFSNENDFLKKLSFISGKISDNANASINSFSSQYSNKGEALNTFEASKYNYMG